MASSLRRHPHSLPSSSAAAAHLLRRFSALPDVDHPPPTSTPTTPRSSPILDLQLAIRGESDPTRIHSLVAAALSSPSTYPRLHTSRPLFSLAASRLARLRRPDLAASILHSLLAAAPGGNPSPGLLARAISLFPSPDDALRAFSDSPPSARSDLSLSALLSSLLRAGRVDEVKATLDSAEGSLGVAPGRASHNVLLHALVRNSEIDAARELLDEMASKRVKHRPAPDIVSYNTVLAGYSSKGDGEGFEKLLKEINDRKLEPNVVTYNCRIQWFAKKGETFKGEELLDVMESKDVAPNYLTYNALVQGYCKEGNVGLAMRVFKRMKVMKRREGRSALGVSAHSQTYVVLFRSLVEKEKLDDALWICKSCFAMKVAPTFEAVKGLVEGLVKGGKSVEAKDVVAKMNLLVKGDAKVAWEKVVGELSLEGAASSNP
uniref:Pentacotripeptide-repeat region of PRORP domain-containing protein n=1 Tax=Leersia perrieri TaxID=77586 RepID=A0A0D9XKT8_9ORYZ